MPFPIEKIIYTELLIDRKQEFIYKNGCLNLLANLKKVNCISRKMKCGNENRKRQPV